MSAILSRVPAVVVAIDEKSVTHLFNVLCHDATNEQLCEVKQYFLGNMNKRGLHIVVCVICMTKLLKENCLQANHKLDTMIYIK
jgi:hypothetical protein